MPDDPAPVETPVSPAVGADDLPDAAVRDGFIFGWRMAELYDHEDLPALRDQAWGASPDSSSWTSIPLNA